MSGMAPKVRIGVVDYLNARPLEYGLEQGLGADLVELSYDVPARLADRMAEDRLDVGLLPIIELARMPEMQLVPGLGIVTRGAARSVLLVSKVPVEQVRSVALDRESRTSNALIQVLFARVWRQRPEFRIGRRRLSLALADCDAAVRIGDKALFETPPESCEVYDLGEIWTRSSGLPFVYAAWMARPGVVTRELYRVLHESRRRGMRNIDRIAADYTWNGAHNVELARAYLRDNIVYRLGSAELESMRQFFASAAELGLIDRAPEIRLVFERWTAGHETAARALGPQEIA
jgi:chorismate dehydratase